MHPTLQVSNELNGVQMFYLQADTGYTSPSANRRDYSTKWLTRALYIESTKERFRAIMATPSIAQATHLHCSKSLLLENLENASNCYYLSKGRGAPANYNDISTSLIPQPFQCATSLRNSIAICNKDIRPTVSKSVTHHPLQRTALPQSL